MLDATQQASRPKPTHHRNCRVATQKFAPSRRSALAGLLSAAAAAGAAAAQPSPPPPRPPGGPQAAPGANPPPPPSPPPPSAPQSLVTIQVPVSSSMSLVHVGSSDSFAITTEGRQAATLLYEALEATDPAVMRDKAQQSSKIYDEIVPRENYGGEYTTLQWFDDYLAADEKDRPGFLTDPQVNFFFQQFSADNYKLLKEYMNRKYRLHDIGDEETKNGQDRKVWLEDTILFENPRREAWERSSELMRLLKIRPGMKIADVGSGPGYYSLKFAKAVGPDGHVYAIDMVEQHLRWVESAKVAMGVTNVDTVETDGRSVGLAGVLENVDGVFLCSLYHNMYAMSTAPERDAFVQSIKQTMGPNGVLWLADNGLVPPGVLPYHGPYVAKELLIAQLLNYGFELLEDHQFVPQRYLLVLRNAPPVAPDQPPPGGVKHS
jgi:SAM-dependent methyltransferase